jgi:hypothetical protein
VTDDDRARRLLAGPRGRRLCAELLQNPDGGLPLWWPVLPGHRQAMDDIRNALARTDLDSIDEGRLATALQASVDRAMYWQEPDEVDHVLADDELTAELAPVADAVVRSAASQWWTEAMDPGAQYAVAWSDTSGEMPAPPRTTGARAALAAWRQKELADEERAAWERPTDPRANWSGAWWSTPALEGLVVTTRARSESARSGAEIRVPLDVPVRLALVEDELGWQHARSWPVHPPATARVLEITGPDVWTALVADHPLDVSASRRHDWWRVTGWDGRWLIPDWAAVAERFDAVHLTVDGYLATAGRALPVDVRGAPARTLLAGWDPDATWWLADVAGVGEPTDWRRRDDEAPRWEPQPTS